MSPSTQPYPAVVMTILYSTLDALPFEAYSITKLSQGFPHFEEGSLSRKANIPQDNLVLHIVGKEATVPISAGDAHCHPSPDRSLTWPAKTIGMSYRIANWSIPCKNTDRNLMQSMHNYSLQAILQFRQALFFHLKICAPPSPIPLMHT